MTFTFVQFANTFLNLMTLILLVAMALRGSGRKQETAMIIERLDRKREMIADINRRLDVITDINDRLTRLEEQGNRREKGGNGA